MIPSIETRKKEIRKKLISCRSLLKDEDRKKYDSIILERILALDEFVRADTILVYASYNGEADTYGLIRECFKAGKKVACPKCRIDDGVPAIDFYLISSLDDLIPGFKGIPEPSGDVGLKLTYEDMSDALVIIPMVGYDKSNNRLGYGKGFYDRFLSAYPDLRKVGIAYSCQEADDLPTDEYDVRLDMIINEL